MIKYKVMIIKNINFEEFEHLIAFNCESFDEMSEYMRIADKVISTNTDLIVLRPEFLSNMWYWLEKTNTKINIDLNYDQDINSMVKEIATNLKKGAGGIKINVQKKNMDEFIDLIEPVKNDLFKDKDFCLSVLLKEYEFLDWQDFNLKLKNLKPDVLIIKTLPVPKMDFVGKIYTMLTETDFNSVKEIHFDFSNDVERIEQTWRLIQKTVPDILDKIRFYIHP